MLKNGEISELSLSKKKRHKQSLFKLISYIYNEHINWGGTVA